MEIYFTNLEASILLSLHQHQVIVPHEQIIKEVWGEKDVSDLTLRAHKSSINKKLLEAGSKYRIETHYKKGYKLTNL